MRILRWFPFAFLALAGSCTLDLDDAPCPCATDSAYECCEATNRCVRHGSFCPSVSGSAGTSGGSLSSAGKSSVSEGGRASGGNAAQDASSGGRQQGGAAPSAGGGSALATAGGATSGGAAAGGRTGSSEGGAPPDKGLDGGASGVGGEGDAAFEPTFANVLTQHNDNNRTGANLLETVLDTTNVKSSTFGELSRRPLRGAVFTQPLVVSNVTLSNGDKADVVYVATMANEVFALDASAPERPALWVRSLGPSIVLSGARTNLLAPGGGKIWHEAGILGTPVAVPAEGALYVAAVTLEDGAGVHRVHKLSLSTGEVSKSVVVQAPGFTSSAQAQASALTFSGGTLYVPFGGYDANQGAAGFVFLYDTELTLRGVVNLGGPDGGGGVTMGGQGLVGTNDGALFTTSPSVSTNVGSRVLELKGATSPEVSERFFPYASSHSLSNELGNSGPILVPNSDRVLVAGQHRFYVVNRRAENPADALLQEFRASGSDACTEIDFACTAQPTSPVLWPAAAESALSRVYVWSPSDLLRSFSLDASTGRVDCPAPDNVCPPLASAAPADSDDNLNHVFEGSAQLSLSANGARPGSGIVWAAHAYSLDTLRNPDGILRAYDAERLRLLWSTEKTTAPFGPIAPTTTITVSGGRAFVATADGISSKQIFWDDWTVGTPALTSFGDEYLVVAWPLSPSQKRGFQIAWSADGVRFADASTLYDDSGYPYDPALASDGQGHIFLAYTTNSTAVKVAASDRPDFFEKTYMLGRAAGGATSTLALNATTAPALAYGGGKLFLAFTNDGALSVLSSNDGLAFDLPSRVTIPNQPSFAAPALAYYGGKLYLVTTNYEHQMSLYVSSDQGAHFEGPTLLPTLSSGHPALMWSSPESSLGADVHLMWADAPAGTTRGRIKVMNAARGDLKAFSRTHEFAPEEAEGSISSALFRGAWHFAWMGVGDQTHPNVARYTSGELVTYGLGGH